jgi:hypothetical protein
MDREHLKGAVKDAAGKLTGEAKLQADGKMIRRREPPIMPPVM